MRGLVKLNRLARELIILAIDNAGLWMTTAVSSGPSVEAFGPDDLDVVSCSDGSITLFGVLPDLRDVWMGTIDAEG